MKLAQLVAQYAAFRKSLGEDFESDTRVLQSFSRSIGVESDIADVRADRVKAFLDGRGPITSYWHRKHTILRGFYRYALSRGHIAVSPLPLIIPKQPQRFLAYIYSHDELRRLLDGTSCYQKQRIHMEPPTFPTILLALY